MDACEPAKPAAPDDCGDGDRAVVLIGRVYGELETLRAENEALKREIAELKKQLAGSAATAKVSEPYSMRAEEKRQQTRGRGKRKESKKQRRGRIANEEKIGRAEETIDIYPDGIAHEHCKLSQVRVVWRMVDGRAKLLAYRMFRGPKKQYGVIPGVLGRSEFGLEIVITLAYMVHNVGLSLDKACLLLGFLQNLKLSKSQADALLRQLSRHWAEEFEVLCTLLANSLVVHADETGWSINSVWAFLSEKARLVLYGVHKDAATLKELLDPELFAGLVVSDDAAVYENFSNSQKCWAHLLRKAIKLSLLDPQNENYRSFTDRLLDIYHEANRIKNDRRLGDAGRERKVEGLESDIFGLCGPVTLEHLPPTGPSHDRLLLALEIMRLTLKKQLFTFVTAPPVQQPNQATKPVGGTNNESERKLRDPAQARATGRTSKTIRGARRTSILTSVLESLRLYLPTYTLSSVIAEIQRWQATGRSCFRELMEKLKLTLPKHSVLDAVLPIPSG